MSKKRILPVLLVLALLAGLISGCGGAPAPQAETPAAATETGSAPIDAPTVEAPSEAEADLPVIPWTTAFHDSSVPEGALPADSIAFLRKNSDGTVDILNVPRDEVYANRPANPPRTHYFEQYMPQELIDELLPILDYAVYNGYSRFCFPASSVTYTMIRQASRYLSYTYDINDKCRINPLTIQRVALGDAEVNFLMITVLGMECSGSVDKYREGLAAAKAVVNAMPEGLDEQEKMLYLYQYVCDNVRYNYGLYYESNDASLLYDALVLHSTVCAGYAEALFVLCNLAGIDCFILSGEVGPLGDVNDLHAWNIARVDGKYYEFDATWDEGKPVNHYMWFGMSENFARISHSKPRSFELEIMPPHPGSLKPVLPSDPEGAADGA